MHMEQLIMLNLMQTPNGSKPSTGSKNNDSDEFRKLMESQGGGESVKPGESQPASGTEKPSETQDVPAEGVAKPVQNDPELEKQMVLAAMAMLQNPVVPVEEVMVPEGAAVVETIGAVESVETVEILPVEVETPAVEIPLDAEPETVETVETLEVPDMPQEETEAVEAGVTPIKAPEAPEESDGAKELNVEVQTREDAKLETDETVEVQEGMAERPVFEDVREVPVKVGEAPAAEKPSEPVEVQVGKQLETALAKGETKVEIQLTPDSLGKIRVEVTLREDGGLLVQLHAENSRTQGILEKNLAGLESLLGRSSQQEVQVEVPRHQESQQQNLFDQQQKEQQQQQQQQQRREHPQNSEDFLQQLRLGLIGPEEVF